MCFSQLMDSFKQLARCSLLPSCDERAPVGGAMASSKPAKHWEEKQRRRIAQRDPQVPPGPRSEQTWAEARSMLCAGLGNVMQPMWGREDPAPGIPVGSAEPGAGLLRAPLQELQEVCRQHAREVLSTTATVLDPMQFTRMVCGRPVQVPFFAQASFAE
jgi:hypothetical protein